MVDSPLPSIFAKSDTFTAYLAMNCRCLLVDVMQGLWAADDALKPENHTCVNCTINIAFYVSIMLHAQIH